MRKAKNKSGREVWSGDKEDLKNAKEKTSNLGNDQLGICQKNDIIISVVGSSLNFHRTQQFSFFRINVMNGLQMLAAFRAIYQL